MKPSRSVFAAATLASELLGVVGGGDQVAELAGQVDVPLRDARAIAHQGGDLDACEIKRLVTAWREAQ